METSRLVSGLNPTEVDNANYTSSFASTLCRSLVVLAHWMAPLSSLSPLRSLRRLIADHLIYPRYPIQPHPVMPMSVDRPIQMAILVSSYGHAPIYLLLPLPS